MPTDSNEKLAAEQTTGDVVNEDDTKKKTVAPRSGILRIAGNMLSILTSDALNRATTFLLYAMISRTLDTRAFGQLTLGLILFYSFQVFAVMGLPTLVTRELAKDRDKTSSYLTNSAIIALLGALVSMAGMALFVWLMRYPFDTSVIILLFGIGLAPYALSTVAEAVLRGWEQMHLIAFANVPANVLKVGAAYWVLQEGYGIREIAIVLVAVRILIFLILYALVLWKMRPRFEFNVPLLRSIFSAATVFLGIEATIAIMGSLQVVLLSKLATESEVGLFNSAGQLLVPFFLLNMSVTGSVFPILCRKFAGKGKDSELAYATSRTLEFLFIVAIPAAVGIFWLAESALVLAYGKPEFAAATLVLRIMAAGISLRAITATLGQALLASGRETTNLRIVGVNFAVSILSSVPLILLYGMPGAAIAVVVTQLVNVVQHYLPVATMLPDFRMLKLIWKPALASAVMVVGLYLLKDQSIWLNIAAGAAIYTLVASPLLFGLKWPSRRIHPSAS